MHRLHKQAEGVRGCLVREFKAIKTRRVQFAFFVKEFTGFASKARKSNYLPSEEKGRVTSLFLQLESIWLEMCSVCCKKRNETSQ